eukprot:13080506-Heterocapsa_arctica.AAC.1
MMQSGAKRCFSCCPARVGCLPWLWIVGGAECPRCAQGAISRVLQCRSIQGVSRPDWGGATCLCIRGTKPFLRLCRPGWS